MWYQAGWTTSATATAPAFSLADYVDITHLSAEGARKFSRMLNEDLKSIWPEADPMGPGPLIARTGRSFLTRTADPPRPADACPDVTGIGRQEALAGELLVQPDVALTDTLDEGIVHFR